MKKLVYNTPHGQLSVRSNGEITLRFESLFMQLSSEQFTEFVNFINTNINIIAGDSQGEDDNSFYHKVLRNMRKEYMSEFKKLINVPIYSLDYELDVFDSLKLMKTKQIGTVSNNINTSLVKIDADAICLN
ncbi:MAG: hypothetical protein PHE33_01890 [Bacteroidales bacterium]|nr:hypothetical protein [Bacteroidales bacterium]